MDLVRIAVTAAWIFAISLLAQGPQDEAWVRWAKSVNERFNKDGAAIKELQDQAVNTDGALKDAQRSLSVQQAAMVKLVKAFDEMPDTVHDLREKAADISKRQDQIQITLDQIKSKQAEPAEADTMYARVAAMAGLCSVLLILIVIALVYQIHRDPVKINETGSVTGGTS